MFTARGALTAVIAAALVTALFAGTARAAGPFNPFQIGLWQGGAWTDIHTGQFSHCAATVPFRSGITMVTSINRLLSWSLGFADPKWTLQPKMQIPVEPTL